MSSTPRPETSAPAAPSALVGVRYSLTQMLAEIRVERASNSFAMEKLDQAGINKLLKSKPRPRAKSKT